MVGRYHAATIAPSNHSVRLLYQPEPGQRTTRDMRQTMSSGRHAGSTLTQPLLLRATRLLVLGIASLPLLRATPVRHAPYTIFSDEDELPIAPDNPTLWIYMAVAVGLVLLGGAFAGLTIALMGQVLSTSMSATELTRHRMRYTCKSSRPPAKAPRRVMLQECSAYSSEASTGCWLHCYLGMLSPTRPYPSF